MGVTKVKLKVVLLIGSMLFLTACGNIEGVVIDKTDSSFTVQVSTNNTEVNNEIYLTDLTTFSGTITSFEELEIGNDVIVVPFDMPEDFSYLLASEVIAE